MSTAPPLSCKYGETRLMVEADRGRSVTDHLLDLLLRLDRFPTTFSLARGEEVLMYELGLPRGRGPGTDQLLGLVASIPGVRRVRTPA